MSANKLSGVAVNLGGSCGGVLYCEGAMVEFVSGRSWAGFRSGLGLRYCRTDEVRKPPNRREARMAEMERKRAMAASRSLGRREEATVGGVGRWLLLGGYG